MKTVGRWAYDQVEQSINKDQDAKDTEIALIPQINTSETIALNNSRVKFESFLYDDYASLLDKKELSITSNSKELSIN